MTPAPTDAATGALILGTAGHVDHGKTALVRALTGQETDRLAEERERGISIELGFAHYALDGRRFGVIDVPGHERFIRNMLAGAHGVDLVLLVVAADDGVMPQTEEHFDIVHLLGVRRLIFVLTKIDLVDEARVAQVREDLEVLACGTAFETAPVCAVSSETGAGVEALRAEIARQLSSLPPREARGYFRMWIDRAFAMHGHGLVVTGTPSGGTVREGDALAVRPGETATRARSIQIHGETVREARVGQRVAVNLGGLEKADAARGKVLADPRVEFPTDRVDCWLEVRSGAPRALRSFDRVRLYVGTAEVMARVIVLGAQKEIERKSLGFCQLALDDEVIVANGDRFVVRSEEATRTTGGGVILHPFATRHKAGERDLERWLAALRDGALGDRCRAFLELLREFAAPVEYAAQALACTIEELCHAARAHDAVIALPSAGDAQALTTQAKWTELAAQVTAALERFHAAHPLDPGMELESLRSRLRVPLPPRVFRPVIERLEAAKLAVREGALVRLPTHRVKLEGSEEDLAGQVGRAIAQGGFTPPDVKQLEAQLAIPSARLTQILRVLEQGGSLVRVAPDLYFEADALKRAEAELRALFAAQAEVTVADYRTRLGASRKYALALLDHFDRAALTLRVGDARRLRR